MLVEFWGSDFKKRKNSTKVPDFPGESREVVIKANFGYENQFQSTKCSIVAPSFFITGASGYGYCKAWGNYYWIRNIEFDIDGAEYITCLIDVLASWKNFIASSTFFVERCADPRYYNIDLRDNALSVEDMISSVTSASTYCNIASDLLYIVKIIGRGTTNGIGTFVMNRFALSDFFSQMWIDIDDGLGLGDLEEFMQMWIADPARYVVGVYSSPIGASIYARNVSNEKVYIGGHETNLELDRINTGQVEIADNLILNKPSSIYGDFRKTDSAFSQYTIYIPTIGTVPLSADVMDTTLSMGISADLLSGDILFTLKSDGDIVASYSGNCYAAQSIGTVNQASNIMSGAMEASAGIITGNVNQVIDGIKTGMQVTPSVIGTQGGSAVVNANEIVISCMQKSSAEFPVNDYGRPCCKNLMLGNLTGYIQCGNASIEIASTDAIRNEINTYLNTGFFME